jgi:hypothetical protein
VLFAAMLSIAFRLIATGELKQKRLPDGSLRLRFEKAYGI